MKILQIVQKQQRRGAEVFAFQLNQELRRQGQEVQTVYLYPYQGTGCLPLQAGDTVLPGQEGHPFEKLLGFHPQLLQHLKGIIQQFQPEVVQVNGARTVKYGAFAGRHTCNGRQILIYRNIGHPHDWLRDWRQRFFYRRLVMPRIDGVVGVSRTTLQAVKEFYHLSVATIHIPRAVDPQALIPDTPAESVRRETQTPLDAPVIIYVGSLTPEKRLDRLFHVAYQVLRDIPDLYVWLVGDGLLRDELTQQVEGLGLAERVRFLGIQENVATYLNAADLFVLTSDTEGIPGVILEAGLLGLPVVTTRVGGIPECVQEGQTGLLVDAPDEAGLACAVLKLLQNPKLRTEMGGKAKGWIEANFTIDKVAQRYLEFYQQVLNGV